jgi:hypothetical protein
MSEFFAGGYAADFALIALALEVVALIQFRCRVPANVITAALPGVCLLLALRAALVGAGWMWVCFWLTIALPAHLLDFWRRPP